jgi:PPOX class probable F420-dependent enzyme
VVIDVATEKGARVEVRLRDDMVAWLVTVAPNGTPVPTPVWFWWDGEAIVVYSQRDKPKLRHIAANPRVAVVLRTDELGDHLIVITADAVADPELPAADANPAYVTKYRDLIARLGTDPRGFAAEYAVPIRLRPTQLRAWWLSDES